MSSFTTANVLLMDILGSFGLGIFTIQTHKLHDKNALGFILQTEVEANSKKEFEEKILGIFTPILESQAVKQVMSEKVKMIEDLRKEIAILNKDLSEIIPYKNHFDIEMKLRNAK